VDFREELEVTLYGWDTSYHLDPSCTMTLNSERAREQGSQRIPVAKLHLDHHDLDLEYHRDYLTELCHSCSSPLAEYLESFSDPSDHVLRALATSSGRTGSLVERYTYVRTCRDADALLEQVPGEAAAAGRAAVREVLACFEEDLMSPGGQRELKEACARAVVGDPPAVAGGPAMAGLEDALRQHWEEAVDLLAGSGGWVAARLDQASLEEELVSAELLLGIDAHMSSAGLAVVPLVVHALLTKEVGRNEHVALSEEPTNEVLEALEVLDAESPHLPLADLLEYAQAL
jgi:hypothetical protein